MSKSIGSVKFGEELNVEKIAKKRKRRETTTETATEERDFSFISKVREEKPKMTKEERKKLLKKLANLPKLNFDDPNLVL